MSMKFEEKRRMKREETVRMLKGMGDLLERGELLIGNKTVLVPDSLEVEVEYKEKDQSSKFEIEMKWDRRDISEKKEPKKVKALPAASITEIKQEMKSRFNAIRGIVEKGGLPSEKEVSEFLSLNRAFIKLADGEGYDMELGDFTSLLDIFSNVVKEGRTEDVKRRIEDIRGAKKSCHKTFRWKEGMD